jgi:hypothetical protein
VSGDDVLAVGAVVAVDVVVAVGLVVPSGADGLVVTGGAGVGSTVDGGTTVPFSV